MIGSADLTSLRFIKEVTWGVTPGSGNLNQIRFTGESLDANVETVVSKEIRPDRSTSDLVPVGQAAGGSFEFEMSFSAFDDFIEGAMFSTFSAQLAIIGSAGDISTTATGIISTDVAKLDAIVPGQWVKLKGFSTNSGENNGYYHVTTAVDGTGDVDFAAAPPSVETPSGTSAEVHGSMIRNGVLQQSYSIEKRFIGLAVTTFQLFTGCMVAGFSQSYAVGEILTGAVEILSKDGVMTEAGFAGLTDTAAPTFDIFNAVNDMKDILIDGVAANKEYLSLTMDLGNNLRGQKAIGTLGNIGVGTGKLEVTGSISVYFDSKSEMDKFVNNTSFALSYRLEDQSGNSYIYTFGKAKYENLSTVAGGENTDLLAEGSWRALLDPTSLSTIQIDRFAA